MKTWQGSIRVVQKPEVRGNCIIPEQYVSAKRSRSKCFRRNNLGDDEQCVAVIRVQPLRKNGLPFHDEGEAATSFKMRVKFWIEKGDEIEEPPKERGPHSAPGGASVLSVMTTGKKYEIRSREGPKHDHIYFAR
jgi:hypothetical protein